MKKSERYKHAIICTIAATGGAFTSDDFEALEMLFEEYGRAKLNEKWEEEHKNDKR